MSDPAATPPGAAESGFSADERPAEPTLLTGGLAPERNAESQSAGANRADILYNPSGRVPEFPDGYELTFARDVSVDTELLGAFRGTAHELGITQGQAQKLADLYAGHAADTARRQAEGLRQAVDGWEAEIKAMPGYAGMRTDAQRALAQYGSPELFRVIDETLIGSHPSMFRFMAAVGKALAEPPARGKSASSAPLTAERIFYPDMQ